MVAVCPSPKHLCGMKRMLCLAAVLLPLLVLAGAPPGLASAEDTASRNDQRLADYFRGQTGVIARQCLADVRSLEDWEARRGEYRRQLQEMLGLWPMPERTDLKPVDIDGVLFSALEVGFAWSNPDAAIADAKIQIDRLKLKRYATAAKAPQAGKSAA